MVWSNHNLAAGFNNQPKPRQRAARKKNTPQQIALCTIATVVTAETNCMSENLQLRDLKCKTINIMFVEKLAKHAIIKLQCNRNSFVLPI